MSTSPLASASQHRPATQNTAPAILESVERARGRAYLAEFDLLRGAAITAVVYLHAYFTPWPEASGGGIAGLRAAHLVAHGAVPLFLFIAAYLQGTGPREGVSGHLRHRWRTIWLPVIAWSGATFAYRVVDEGLSAALWRDLALADISGQFYFAWLLLAFGVLLSQGWRVPDRWLWPLAGIAFAVNFATIGWYEQHGAISGLFATLAYRNPLAWAFFPVVGYALGRKRMPEPPVTWTVAALAVMSGAAAVHLIRGVAAGTWPVSYFGVTVFLFSAASLFVYPRAARALLSLRPIANPLVWLSAYAFPVYLVHLPFVIGFGTREVLGKGEDWTNYWLLLHANAAVGLFGSLAFVLAVERTSPWLARRVLGLRRLRPAQPEATGERLAPR